MSEPSTLHLTVISAEGLKNVNTLWKKTRPYAVAWVDPEQKKRTQGIQRSAKNPFWNESLVFQLNLQCLQNPDAALVIQVLTEMFFQTKTLGTAALSINEIRRACCGENSRSNTLKLQLWRPSGKACGFLTVSLKLQPKCSVFHNSSLTALPPEKNCTAVVSNSTAEEGSCSTNSDACNTCFTNCENPGFVSAGNGNGCNDDDDVPVQGIPVAVPAICYPPVEADDSATADFHTHYCHYTYLAQPQPQPQPQICYCHAPSAPPLPQNENEEENVGDGDGVKSFLMGMLSGAAAAVIVGGAVLHRLRVAS